MRKLLAQCRRLRIDRLVQRGRPRPSRPPPGRRRRRPAYGANAAGTASRSSTSATSSRTTRGSPAQIEALKKEMEAADGKLKADRDRLVADGRAAQHAEAGQRRVQAARRGARPPEGRLQHQAGHDSPRLPGARSEDLLPDLQRGVPTRCSHFAQQNNIGMVLRFNGDPIDPQQREDVMRAIMQPIVYPEQHRHHARRAARCWASRAAAGGAGAAAAAASPTAAPPGGDAAAVSRLPTRGAARTSRRRRRVLSRLRSLYRRAARRLRSP